MSFNHFIAWPKLKVDETFRWDQYQSVVIVIATGAAHADRLERLARDLFAVATPLCSVLTWEDLQAADFAESPMAGIAAAARAVDPIATVEHSFAVWVRTSSILKFAATDDRGALVGGYVDVTGGDDAYLRKQLAKCVSDAAARQGADPRILDFVLAIAKFALAAMGVAAKAG